MIQNACLCGYQAADRADLGDHLAEVFSPDDDTAADGRVHAEAGRDDQAASASLPGALGCLCGFTAHAITELDEHLTTVFTPEDHTGRDGVKHGAGPVARS